MEVRSALGPLPRRPGACSPTHACRLVGRPRAGLLIATPLASGAGLTLETRSSCAWLSGASRSLANGTRAGLILGRALALDAIGWPRALDDRCDATEQALSTSWRGCYLFVLVSPAARQT